MMHNPPHPGSVLKDYLGGISVTQAAKHLRVSRVSLSRVLNGQAAISPAMALKLSQALNTSPELWIGMQSQHDLWQAMRKTRLKIRPLTQALSAGNLR